MNFLQNLANAARQKAQQVYHTVNTDYQHAYNAVVHPNQPAPPPPQQQHPVVMQHPALPQQGQPGFGVMRPGVAVPRQLTPQQVQQQAHPSLIHQIGTAIDQTGKQYGLSLKRTAVGFGQMGSGLYDLAGQHVFHNAPSGATNRFDKVLNNAGQSLDQRSQNIGGPSQAAYKIGQVSSNLGSFLVPGAAAKGIAAIPKVANAIDHAAPVINVASKVAQPFDTGLTKAAATIATKGPAGRIAAAGLKGGLSGTNLLNTAAGTAMTTGNMASHGQKVTGKDVALNAAQNLALGTGLAVAPQAAKEAIGGAKVFDKTLRTAQNKATTNQAIDSGIKDLTKQQQALQTRINKAPLNATRGTESLQQHINMLEQQKAQLNANRPTMSRTERVLAMQPGGSMRPVRPAKAADMPIEPTAPKATPAPQAHPIYGTLEDFKNKYSVGLGEVNRLKKDANGTEFWGKDQQLSRQVNGKGIYSTEDLYKHLTASSEKPALAQPEPSVPGQPPASRGTGGVSSAKSTMKERGLTTGMQNSEQFSPELKQSLNSSYKPATDKAATMKTSKFIAQPLDQAHMQVLQTLGQNKGTHLPGASGNIGVKFGKQEVSNAGAVMQLLDKAGRYDEAQQIHNMLAEKLTNAGQTAQATKLIYNRSPEGLRNMGLGALADSGAKMTKGLSNQIDNAIQKIKDTTDGTPENQLARKQYDKLIGTHLPTSAGTKALSLYKTGILSSPKTAVKVLGAGVPNMLLENAADAVAAPIDKVVSLFNHGKREVTMPGVGSTVAGAKALPKALTDAKIRFKDDIAMPGSTGLAGNELSGTNARPHGANFGIAKDGSRTKLDKLTGGTSSKILNGYTSSIGRVHGAFQTLPFETRGAQVLYQTAKAEAITKGLKGADRAAYIQEHMTNPTARAKQLAETASEYATSQQKTALGSAASGIQRTMPGGQVIAPITRIPGAVATQVINYSPAGALKTVGSALLDKRAGNEFDQAGFSRGLGRSVVGTGLMAGGAALALQGRVSGGYPKDKATQQLWQSANIPANSVYVGGHAYPNEPWKNTGGTWQQVSSPGGAGAQAGLTGGAVVDGYKQGGIPQAALQGAQGGAQIITNQPYLTGVSGAMGAINTPSQAKSFLDQTAGSIVPNFVRDAATSTDPLQRQTSVQSPITSMKNSITNGIPVFREHNQPQVDVFGNVLRRNNDPITAALNPLNPQTSNPSSLTNAMGAIHNVKDVNGKPLSIPTQADKKIQYVTPGGLKATLSDAQRTQYIQQSGQAAQARMNQMIASPTYQNATPAQQSKMLDDIMSGNRNLAQTQLPNSAVKLTGPGKLAKAGNLPAIDTSTNKVTTAANVTGTYKLNDGSMVVPKDLTNQYSQGVATLTSSRKSGDYSGYMKTAQAQLSNISKQLQNPNLTDKQRTTLANDAQALNANIYKYGTYGSFTKPAGVKTVKTLSNGSITGARQDYVSNITKSAAKYGVDPNAALAVAAAEGLGGGVGDKGTSFGPFQLHIGGALPQGKNQAWAESPAGIDYAMQKIAQAANGKTGQAAISSIVNGFEKPLDPNGEIARALAVYTGGKVDLTNTQPAGATITTSSSGSTSSKKTTSLGLGKSGGFKAYKSNLGSTIKAARASGINARKYQVAKAHLNSRMSSNSISGYKQPKLTLRKKR